MTLPSSQGQEPNFCLTGFLKLVKFSFSQNPICTSCQSWFSKHNSQFTVTDTSIPSTGQSTTTAGRILSDGFYPKQWNFTELAQANPNKREACLLLAFLVPVYRLLYKGILVWAITLLCMKISVWPWAGHLNLLKLNFFSLCKIRTEITPFLTTTQLFQGKRHEQHSVNRCHRHACSYNYQ